MPPLLTVLRHAPPEVLTAAAGCLIPLSIWRPRLVGLHGGVPLLARLLRSPMQPLARLAAVQILAQLVLDEDDCGALVTGGGMDALMGLARDGRGGRKNLAGIPSWERHTRDGALWTLARVATHKGHLAALMDSRVRDALLAALAGDDGASSLAAEAALMLVLKLGKLERAEDERPAAKKDAATAGTKAWRRALALDASKLVAACAGPGRPEPVRAQAAKCFCELYATDKARHLLVFGRDVRDEEMTSDTDFGPTDYLEVVYGKESAEAAAGRAAVKANKETSRAGVRRLSTKPVWTDSRRTAGARSYALVESATSRQVRRGRRGRQDGQKEARRHPHGLDDPERRSYGLQEDNASICCENHPKPDFAESEPQVDDQPDPEEELKAARAREKTLRAGPPSTRLHVFDADECRALRDAPSVKKGFHKVIAHVGVPRKVAFDGSRLVWETRAKASGLVASIQRHNESACPRVEAVFVLLEEDLDGLLGDTGRCFGRYEAEHQKLLANPALVEAMRAEAKHRQPLFGRRIPDPCARKDLGDDLPPGFVDEPPSYDSFECHELAFCARADPEILEMAGVPETAHVRYRV